MEGHGSLLRNTRTDSLLIGLFRAFWWSIVEALAPPVTPEVAGSSPVAPVTPRHSSWLCHRVFRVRDTAFRVAGHRP
jgi:hypothetical protein